MKKTIFVLLMMILAVSFFSCVKNTPAEPAPPATETPTPGDTATFTETHTITETPTNTMSPTPTATPDSRTFDFESTLESWEPENSSKLSMSVSSDQSSTGSASIKGVCNIYGSAGMMGSARALLFNELPYTANLEGKTISVDVYVPSDLATLSNKYRTAMIFEDSAGNYHHLDGVDVDSIGWNNYTFNPDPSWETHIVMVAFEIYKISDSTPDWAGTIYIDNINW